MTGNRTKTEDEICANESMNEGKTWTKGYKQMQRNYATGKEKKSIDNERNGKQRGNKHGD